MYRFGGSNTSSRSNGIYCEPDLNYAPPPPSTGTLGAHKKRNGRGIEKGRGRGKRGREVQFSSRNIMSNGSEENSSSDLSDSQQFDPPLSSHSHHHSLHNNRINTSQPNGGIDSPPEPAPSEIPLRMNGTHMRSIKSYERSVDLELDSSEHYAHQPNSGVYHPQEYLMSSPYQPKSPMPLGTSLATAKKLFQNDNHQNETADSNSTLSTLPSQARLMNGGVGCVVGSGVGGNMPTAPLILPLFPNSTPHPGQLGNGGRTMVHYSPNRFSLQKECSVSDRCSWKCVSLALILLSTALLSILIYFTATMGSCSRFPGNGCIVVDDVKVMARGEKHLPVIPDHTSASPQSNGVDEVSPTSLIPSLTSPHPSLPPSSSIEWSIVPLLLSTPLSLPFLRPHSYTTLSLETSHAPLSLLLNLTLPPQTQWAILTRLGALPSLLHHHSAHFVEGGRGNVVLYNQLPSPGIWYIRLFNDNGREESVEIEATEGVGEGECSGKCSGRGKCVRGKCVCDEGYSGTDCRTSICPVLCSEHGRYGGGECHCENGWKGAECDILESECEIGNCNGNGECVDGKCSCKLGWIGDSCEHRDCEDSTCSNHGICTKGRCFCDLGWTGVSCNFPSSFLSKCLPDCSGKGEFDAGSGKCICQKPYGGPNCLEVTCESDCGPSASCNESGECECLVGWRGEKCEELACDERCSEHGSCKNGTCICSPGWNGKHCSLAGCPNSCTDSAHGSCILQDGYSCKCKNGWAGLDCSIRLETNCADEIDNDEDGMIDCSDSECCESSACKEHLMCMTANDPVEVLLRKQPPSVTSSFYQRVKFLIEEESVQSYAQKDEYWESHFWSSFEHRRVSVIRGQVLSANGLGIVGIRVSVDKSQRLGFTLTRKGGWFDMLVNGGGAVTLQFQRNPFRPLTRTVFVPWNEIVVLDPPVLMTLSSSPSTLSIGYEDRLDSHPPPCSEHELQLLRPVVLSSWFPQMVGAAPQYSHVFTETQILQESIRIPGSDVHLLYHSSQSPGYLATILISLSASPLPPTLSLIHLKIVVEGELYRRTFEAEANLTYTFGWRKRNVYQQKVYGLALARVHIGYEYRGCEAPIWIVRTVTLKGFDVDISDVGGWNLDIHHHYNFQEGILQKGDGTEVHLRDERRVVGSLLGRRGEERELDCDPSCPSTLLSPLALSTGPDGSIYVGDFNLIRRILPDNRTYTLLQLSPTKVSHQYYITISPADGHLYISDPEKYQVLRVVKMEEVGDPRLNWSPVIGSGKKCVPGDVENCGDGSLAKLAKLSHPKGLAITSGGSVYLADGPLIRFVGPDGIISTLLGSLNPSPFSPGIPLLKTSDFEGCWAVKGEGERVRLHWPTVLVLDFVESRVLFVDEGVLLSLSGSRVERVLSCEKSKEIGSPLVDVALSPRGEMYFVTQNSKLYSLRNEEVSLVRTNSEEAEMNNLGAVSVSALTIGADSTIYVLDQGGLELKKISQFLPSPNQNGDYEVVFNGELYVFNRYGQHVLTKDIKSARTLYSFLYTKNTSYGKLSKVSDSAENKILFLRDYSSVVSTIENTQGQKSSLKINRLGRLITFEEGSGISVRVEYSEDGLLLSRSSSTSLLSLYSYDSLGRISRVVSRTGDSLEFSYKLEGGALVIQAVGTGSGERRVVSVGREGEGDVVRVGRWDSNGSSLGQSTYYNNVLNGSYGLETETGLQLRGDSSSSQLLSDSPDSLSNSQEWRTGGRGRELWVNGSKVLTLDLSHGGETERIINSASEPILTLSYAPTGYPLSFTPQPPLHSLNLTYDRFNRLGKWAWSSTQVGEEIEYGRSGFGTSVRELGGRVIREIEYGDGGRVGKIRVGGRREWSYSYDEAGGLQTVQTPKGTKHRFYTQDSVGYRKFVYTPPGYKSGWIRHYNSEGLLIASWLPGEGGRLMFSYDSLNRPISLLYSEGKFSWKYRGLLTIVSGGGEKQLEPTVSTLRTKIGKITQVKMEYGPKSGLSSANFIYEYDSNFRPTLIKTRIGGHPHDYPISYSSKTGKVSQQWNFRMSVSGSESSIFDGVAIFSRVKNSFGALLSMSLSIQGMETVKITYSYEPTSHRLSSFRINGKNGGLSTIPPQNNFTYDAQGQLSSAPSWKFEYDANGNLENLTYRGNRIPLEHNERDEIVKLGDGSYRYDSGGRLTLNANEEHFSYNSLGELKRVWKRAKYEIEYYYDVEGRLIGRRDSVGNITQYFYSDIRHPTHLTHVLSPKENRLLTFSYDGEGRLIFIQINRGENFYVLSDLVGTPLLVYNQYGLVVKEISRGPFGHVIYDSDPTFYLPIDFQGGIVDKVTLLVHMREKRVYDPLIGQFLTPKWEGIEKQLENPEKIHPYRLSGNDPINLPALEPPLTQESWLSFIGYDLNSLSPQLFLPPSLSPPPSSPLSVSGLESRILSNSLILLPTIPVSKLGELVVVPSPGAFLSSLPSPLGPTLLLSRSGDGRGLVHSSPMLRGGERDVFTQILNGTEFLPPIGHGGESLHFVKREYWKASDDLADLKRLEGLVNVTVHEKGEMIELRIQMFSGSLVIKYGTTGTKEEARLLHHAKGVGTKRAWALLKESISQGDPHPELTGGERDLVLKNGQLTSHHPEFTHDPEKYTFFADDPLNVRFVKKGKGQRRNNQK